ncbi:hypothetical protein APHAL10511_001176 [Amanita phalloides]|nr:hypothetical protein APHAL10511_001176 [Amanita phalloides]
MSGRQSAVLALALVLHACDTALCSLDNKNQSDVINDAAVIRCDLLSLLAILHHAITKVSLALKPSSPSYGASVTPLNDIATRIASIAHCAGLFTPVHGLVLTDEAVSLVKQVIQSIRSLIQTLLDANNGTTKAEHVGDDYLIITAAVHDLIDKARSPDGLSLDNVSAVRKLWLRDQASLEDGYVELVQMIENASDKEEQVDDGRDELGLGTNHLSLAEADRAKKAQPLGRLSILLHKRVNRDLLSHPYPSDLNPCLDLLAKHSSSLLVSSDDLIASLDSPQSMEDIAIKLTCFRKSIQDLQPTVVTLLQDKKKQWFNACFGQIFRSADAMSNAIDSNS